mgnify:CR=1 FL=1
MTDIKQLLTNEKIFFKEENINGINCAIGYIKKFKWRWIATQLNTFIIIGQTEQLIDRSLIEEFSTSGYKYSIKNNRGWPRGIQSGVGSIAILQGENIDYSAVEFCRKFPKKHWSVFEIPVLFDLNTKTTIKYSNKPLWGAMYFPFFTKTIDAITAKL